MERYFARLAISTASLLIAAVIAVAAIVALWGAVYLALLQTFTPAIAALLTGIGALLFCVLIVLLGNWFARMQTAPHHAKRSSQYYVANEAAVELGRLLGNQLYCLTQSEAQGATVAALVAGFAVGASPRLRSFLEEILKSK